MAISRRAIWPVGVALAAFMFSVVASVFFGKPFLGGFGVVTALGLAGVVVTYFRNEANAVRFKSLGVYLAVWIGFVYIRARADDIGFPDRGETAASLDRWLGAGATPTERLQEWFHIPGQLGIVDQLAVLIHVSYYLVPHLLAFVIWLRRDERSIGLFEDYFRTTLLVLGTGLLLYVLVPTSPPWLLASDGVSLDVTRIIWAADGKSATNDGQVYALVTDPNPTAAMPSLHTAITVLAAWIAWRAHRTFGTILAIYAAAMGISLVYLAEHFVVDVIAGVALAVGVAVIDARYRPRAPRRRELVKDRAAADSLHPVGLTPSTTLRTHPETESSISD